VGSAALLCLSLALAGCGTSWFAKPADANTPEAVYRGAKEEMASGGWDRAIKELQRVEGLAAGTLLGQQAILDLAYSQWRGADKPAALATLDRFIKQNPSSPALDYALYLRGVVNFNDNLGLFGALSGQRLAERDQRASRDAWASFKQLVDQFPQSRYAEDARVRMNFIMNSLAENEVAVARYYMRRGAWVAALGRAQTAVTEFQQSPAGEEALAIMIEAYERLDMKPLRDSTVRVLQANYPQSRFLAENASQATQAARPWWRLW
jgi:outer membrane protein assembly factor BamD